MIKLHIAMNESDVAELNRLAKRAGVPKSQVIREAVGTYLVENRRRERHAVMRTYAQRLDGRSAEFTSETAAHVTERLLRETRW